jgi:hypothetical protein
VPVAEDLRRREVADELALVHEVGVLDDLRGEVEVLLDDGRP